MTTPNNIPQMTRELTVLKGKIHTLECYLFHDAEFLTLPINEQIHLSQQLGHMKAYASTLHTRLIDKRLREANE